MRFALTLLAMTLAMTSGMPGGSLVAADPAPRFEEQVIEPNIGKVCYGLTLADVNGDSRQDVVAVSENRVLWYENPTWTLHEMIVDQTVPDNVCIAPYDIDGDGQIDFALGAGWMGKNTGTLQWLRRGKSLSDRWTVHAIGAEPSTHRMRFADVLGTGRAQLVVSPLNASQGPGVRLLAFEIPADPVHDRWQETILNHDLNRMHNHWHVHWHNGQAAQTLTASREGIHFIELLPSGFFMTQLAPGTPGDQPNQRGAGEIKDGRLPNGDRFLTSVEPMHGTMLAVYLHEKEPKSAWKRVEIDASFQRGHALWTADLDGDGADEIVFGHSDTPGAFGVQFYKAAKPDGSEWTRHNVDVGGMATEDLIVGDLNGDQKPDIIAGGRSTHNVKIYWNR
jgi:hypothetical protein